MRNLNKRYFFDGQIYDAFSLLIGLIQKAEMEIVLVDGYVDVGTLNILSKKKRKCSGDNLYTATVEIISNRCR